MFVDLGGFVDVSRLKGQTFGLVTFGAVKLLAISSQKFQTAVAVSQLVC